MSRSVSIQWLHICATAERDIHSMIMVEHAPYLVAGDSLSLLGLSTHLTGLDPTHLKTFAASG